MACKLPTDHIHFIKHYEEQLGIPDHTPTRYHNNLDVEKRPFSPVYCTVCSCESELADPHHLLQIRTERQSCSFAC